MKFTAPLAVLVVLSLGASALKLPSHATNTTKAASATSSRNATKAPPAAGNATHSADATEQELRERVDKLHRKMEGVVVQMQALLKGTDTQGNMAESKVAPTLQFFVDTLRGTLNRTASPKDLPGALKELQAAQASMKNLTAALTVHQSELMHETEAQETSLLLGVLMTRKASPMDQQLEILRAADFRDLPVVKALLREHDPKTPLFEQAAAYVDKAGAKEAAMKPEDAKVQQLNKTLSYFSKRAAILEQEEENAKKRHEVASAKVDALIKKSSKEKAHQLQLMRKQSDREYRKHMASHHQQTKMMKDVVAALRRGDVAALQQAQAALQASLKSMEAQTGNFLHFLQLGHRLARRDCPYCAAQCIDKCHTAGNPYAKCLADCADAGK